MGRVLVFEIVIVVLFLGFFMLGFVLDFTFIKVFFVKFKFVILRYFFYLAGVKLKR